VVILRACFRDLSSGGAKGIGLATGRFLAMVASSCCSHGSEEELLEFRSPGRLWNWIVLELLRVLTDDDLQAGTFSTAALAYDGVSEVRQKTFKKTRWPNINLSEKPY
jgi:hypothetical protein